MTKPELEALNADLQATPSGFVELILGLPLYPWQSKALTALEQAQGPNSKRTKIAVVSPNGAGKSERIVAGAALYWVTIHKRGKVVITTKDARQLTEQIYPALTRHREKFEGWTWVTSPNIKITTATGGTINAFTTDDPGRAEGWHKEDNTEGPLLIIIDEAKSVPEPIFQAFDRCTFNAIIYTSSPGSRMGRFYEAFQKHAESFLGIRAGLKDCPHVPKEKIDDIVKTYGADHPFTKSTNEGEFMSQEDMDQYVVTIEAWDAVIASPPKHKPGFRIIFCDFGGAQSEHVACLRDGNKYTILDAWLEANKEAAVNRFIRNFKKAGFKEEDGKVWGDASDSQIAKLFQEAGWTINRQNFGDKANNEGIYVSWGAEAWWDMGLSILKGDVILPDDPKLKAQATTRKKTIGSKGKLGIEEKHDMAKPPRYLPSPDRFDAVAGAGNVHDFSMLNDTKQPFTVTGWREELEREGSEQFLESIGASAGL